MKKNDPRCRLSFLGTLTVNHWVKNYFEWKGLIQLQGTTVEPPAIFPGQWDGHFMFLCVLEDMQMPQQSQPPTAPPGFPCALQNPGTEVSSLLTGHETPLVPWNPIGKSCLACVAFIEWACLELLWKDLVTRLWSQDGRAGACALEMAVTFPDVRERGRNAQPLSPVHLRISWSWVED